MTSFLSSRISVQGNGFHEDAANFCLDVGESCLATNFHRWRVKTPTSSIDFPTDKFRSYVENTNKLAKVLFYLIGVIFTSAGLMLKVLANLDSNTRENNQRVASAVQFLTTNKPLNQNLLQEGFSFLSREKALDFTGREAKFFSLLKKNAQATQDFEFADQAAKFLESPKIPQKALWPQLETLEDVEFISQSGKSKATFPLKLGKLAHFSPLFTNKKPGIIFTQEFSKETLQKALQFIEEPNEKLIDKDNFADITYLFYELGVDGVPLEAFIEIVPSLALSKANLHHWIKDIFRFWPKTFYTEKFSQLITPEFLAGLTKTSPITHLKITTESKNFNTLVWSEDRLVSKYSCQSDELALLFVALLFIHSGKKPAIENHSWVGLKRHVNLFIYSDSEKCTQFSYLCNKSIYEYFCLKFAEENYYFDLKTAPTKSDHAIDLNSYDARTGGLCQIACEEAIKAYLENRKDPILGQFFEERCRNLLAVNLPNLEFTDKQGVVGEWGYEDYAKYLLLTGPNEVVIEQKAKNPLVAFLDQTFLKELRLPGSSPVSEYFLYTLGSGRWKVLDISKTSSLLLCSLWYYSGLTELDISSCIISNLSGQGIFFRSMPKLKKLNASHCMNFDDAVVSNLYKLKELTSLNVSECKITEIGLQIILTTLPCLKYLDISHNAEIEGNSFGKKVQSVPKPGPSKIDLEEADYTEKFVQSLSKYEKEQFEKDLLTIGGVVAWTFRPEPNPTRFLTGLNLEGCRNISQKALESIAKFTTLEFLNLSYCRKITNGLILSKLKNLEELYLKNTKPTFITNNFLEQLTTLTNLKILDITNPQKLSCDEIRLKKLLEMPSLGTLTTYKFPQEGMDILKLKAELSDRIIGQPKGVSALCDVLTNLQVGNHTRRGPVGVFIFAGPPGLGKTDLPKIFAEKIGRAWIDISVNSNHNPSDAVTTPENILIPFLRANPKCVVLLDEFDRGSKEIKDVFMRLLGDGRYLSNNGEEIDGREAIFVLTTNLGSDTIIKSTTNTLNLDLLKNEIERGGIHLANIDRTQVIPFFPLNEQDKSEVIELKLNDFKLNEARKEIFLSWDRNVIKFILTKLGKSQGTRELEKVLGKEIITPISELEISRKILKGNQVVLQLEGRGERALITFKVS